VNWLTVSRDLLISGWVVVVAIEAVGKMRTSAAARRDGRGRLLAAVVRLRYELEELSAHDDWRSGALVQRNLALDEFRRPLREVDQLKLKQDEYVVVARLEKAARDVESLLDTRRSLAIAEVTGTAVSQAVSDALSETLRQNVRLTLQVSRETEAALEKYLKRRISVTEAWVECPSCGLTQVILPDKRHTGAAVSCAECGAALTVTVPLEDGGAA